MNNYDLFYQYHYKNDAYNRSNKKAQCLSIYRSNLSYYQNRQRI